ncbi:putative nucleotidyltransferase [Piscirickettsia salmonis]|uniref:nucleotidyltransferase domain-containing protein n=1 Tax=Piscirickettsia salmonis TaxID=1238 RepID=UPI0012B8B76A|nr:nucleotidyltransferase domain-containing protein [Piscirickettsia salmonis]QGP51419.1 putative nucleotidyltransferase [Piscirickettsia salmonis]
MNHGLPERTVKTLQGIFKAHPVVEKVILFGSRAKGNFKEYSDIDLALVGKVDYSLANKVKSEIEESDIPYEVDVCAYAEVDNSAFKKAIDDIGLVFYEK